jgi:hypothetical protein
MASIVTHPAVPLALAVACGRRYVSGRLLLAGVSASILPDADLFFSDWGWRVLRSEALWVWLPGALVGGLGFLIRWGPKAGHALKRTAESASTADMPGVSNAGSGASTRCRRQEGKYMT